MGHYPNFSHTIKLVIDCRYVSSSVYLHRHIPGSSWGIHSLVCDAKTAPDRI